MLLTSPLPEDALRRGKAVYDEMRTELMAGQYLDLLEQAHGGGSRERAMRVVRYKSAKYTIERPLHLGARLAGGSAGLVDGLSAYGLPLGEAFQLRDDVLGVFGDPEVTGKPAGDDLREGKRTVLIATAMERASSTQAERLRSGLGDPGLGVDGVTELREIIEDTGARAETESAIDTLLTASLDALHHMALPEPTTSVLEGLAFAATRRSL
jgi:geranylgeranyl diphosphate synthase type I